MTPVQLIHIALKSAGVIGIGQTPDAEDTNDAFIILNTILTEWQMLRYLSWDLVEATATSTGAASYPVGLSQAFNVSFAGQRPDKIDAAFVRLISTGADTILYPFMSREGFDRVALKSTVGPPESYFYDPTSGTNGTVYFYPVPDTTWALHINAKCDFGQFPNLTTTITLPLPYITALLWNLADNLRPLYQLPPDPRLTARAEATLFAVMNSVAQVPQAVQPTPSRRGGIYSMMQPPQQGNPQQ